LNLNTENALAPNPYDQKALGKVLVGGRLEGTKQFEDMRLSHEAKTFSKEPLTADLTHVKPQYGSNILGLKGIGQRGGSKGGQREQ
jgi:hypothetical protein